MGLMPDELSEGSVLARRFRLERLLGKGGMGIVWSATNTATGRRVAIKLLREDSVDDPQVRRRFLREGRAASAVRHPNVVEILDVLELEGDRPAMVMELLEGESLGQRLRREGKLSLADVASLLVPAVAATGAAHAHGIVHRDLKPDNIFLANGHSEGDVVVKVLDFGIAKMISEVEQNRATLLTSTGSMLGTPSYMAPEQLFSEGTLDYRCDIWALGVILYECLAGKRPARGETFADIVKVIATRAIVPIEKVLPDLPRDVTELVGRMLSFDADARPRSLQEVCDVLGRYTDVEPAPFGEPLPDAIKRSGGIDKALIPLLLEDARASSPTLEAPSASASASAETETVDVRPDNETQSHLNQSVSVSSRPVLPRRRRAWPYVVAIGVAATGLAFAGRDAFRSPAPSAASPALPSFAPAPPSASTAALVIATPSAEPSAVPSAAPSASPSAKPTSHVAVARPKPTTLERAPATTSSAVPSTAPTAVQTASPGGLVEKPPF